MKQHFRQISVLWFSLLLYFAAGANMQEASTAPSVEIYHPLTFSIAIDPARYTNPFDATDIELVGVFTAPSGAQFTMPGYWMQPFENDCMAQTGCTSEALRAVGEPLWRVRFTPTEVGSWTFTLQVRDDDEIVETEAGQFTVEAGEHPGFIRTASNGRYFRFDDGSAYFPIGHNLGWSWEGGGGVNAYQQWFEELRANGANSARIYLDVPWFIGLEWGATAGDYRERQLDAARLDAVVELAEEYGITLQFALLWVQSLRFYSAPPVEIPTEPARPDTHFDWERSPYNAVNGGPIPMPEAFFVDEGARQFFKRRLRYVVARWGYSPQIFAWELGDELDTARGYDPQVVRAWLDEMSAYLREIDPYDHLITAGSRAFDPMLAAHEALDFSQVRYTQDLPLGQPTDIAAGVWGSLQPYFASAQKPVLITDFTLNPYYEPLAADPDGLHVQQALWASALSGAGGSAVGAWWETYMMPRELSRYYVPLRAFTAGVDWASVAFTPREGGVLLDGARYGDVRLSGFDRRFLQRPRAVIERRITADGVYPPLEDLPSYLYGQVFNSDFRQPQIYRLAPPVDTYVEIRVRTVSSQGGARLVVILDAQPVAELDLQASSQNVSVRVFLPVGEHTILLDNAGEDWLEIDAIIVENFATPLQAYALHDSNAGVALIWLHHREATWRRLVEGEQPQAVRGQYRLDQMPSGAYLIEFWNPLNGVVLGEDIAHVADDGLLLIDLLPINHQLALRIFPLDAAPTPLPIMVTATLAPTFSPQIEASSTPLPILVQTNTPRPED